MSDIIDGIQRLPVITIKGLEKKDYVNVVRFKGRLYCIDDPRLLDDAKDIVVVDEVDDEKRLWHYYISNNLKNRINMVQLLILYHKGIITDDAIPEQIQHIVDNTKDIPIELLDSIQGLINELESKGNPILVDETITYGIKRFIDILKEAGVDEKKIHELLIDTLNSYRTTELNILRLSTARGLELMAEEYVRRLRKRKIMITTDGGYIVNEGNDDSEYESKGKDDNNNSNYTNENNYNDDNIVTYTIRITGKKEYVEQVINILNEIAERYDLHMVIDE